MQPQKTQRLRMNTRVVLVTPSLPENVGAVARAMGHFGLGQLVVTGELDPCDPRARTLAAGHDAILERARRSPDLDAAVAGCGLVVGTTARPQDGVARQVITPEQAACIAADHAEVSEVALVFGPEKRGLSNAELLRCDQLVSIDGEPGTCLNLAQAAAVLGHAWRQASQPGEVRLTRLALETGLPDLAPQLLDWLAQRGLVKAREREGKLHTLRRVLSRATLSADEAAMLQAWLQALKHRAPGP
ncbi:MAG: TrmH family RNA methyltransferase [Candidatus Sericytochromatia bacterium]|nr:TrmH family RNA methyltransferase [Candidatus Sericytochromatia bacterium]